MHTPEQAARITEEVRSHAFLVTEEETGDKMLAARVSTITEQAVALFLGKHPNIGGYRIGSGSHKKYPYGVATRASIIYPTDLHQALVATAKAENVSMNTLVNRLCHEYLKSHGGYPKGVGE